VEKINVFEHELCCGIDTDIECGPSLSGDERAALELEITMACTEGNEVWAMASLRQPDSLFLVASCPYLPKSHQ
jgi:hypothetical protein